MIFTVHVMMKITEKTDTNKYIVPYCFTLCGVALFAAIQEIIIHLKEKRPANNGCEVTHMKEGA